MKIQYTIKAVIVCSTDEPEDIAYIMDTIRELGEAEITEAIEIKEE